MNTFVLVSRTRHAIFAAAGALALLGAEPAESAAPNPSPSPGPQFKVIERVRAVTPFCRAVISRADDAIEIALDNDVRIGSAILGLRRASFENVIVKGKSVRELTKQMVGLRKAAIAGDALVRELKAEAKAAPTAEQARNLNSFADALAGALYRQRRVAVRMGQIIAYFDAHDIIDPDGVDVAANALGKNSAFSTDRDQFYLRRESPTALARYAADDLQERIGPITRDETDAADRVDAAFTGC